MANTTVYRLLKQLKFKPYKHVNAQKLDAIDKQRRLVFCDWINTSQLDPKLIWFSDEKTFRINGKLNKHNHRSWNSSRPEDIPINGIKAHSQSVMVWIEISSAGHICPYFFGSNVNHHTYQEMLENYFLPALNERFN